MNDYELYSNITLLSTQFISKGMQEQDAVKKAEEICKELLQVTKRVIKNVT